MKTIKHIIFAFIVFFFVGCNGKPAELHVMTFNIRLDVASDAQHNWYYRKDAAAALIRDLDIDIAGTQEVLHNQLLNFLERLPGYASIGVGRQDGKTLGEYSAILYKVSRFEVKDSGTFWLSDRPDEPGSVGWDAALERIVSWAILKDKKSAISFAVFNTHYDHVGHIARAESSKLLLKKIKQIAGNLPIVLTGDFNGDTGSEPIQIIKQSGLFFDARELAETVSGPDWSFHGFGRTKPEQRRMIDFIFVTDGIKIISYDNIFEEIGDTYHSDHNPIWVKMTIQGE